MEGSDQNNDRYSKVELPESSHLSGRTAVRVRALGMLVERVA